MSSSEALAIFTELCDIVQQMSAFREPSKVLVHIKQKLYSLTNSLCRLLVDNPLLVCTLPKDPTIEVVKWWTVSYIFSESIWVDAELLQIDRTLKDILDHFTKKHVVCERKVNMTSTAMFGWTRVDYFKVLEDGHMRLPEKAIDVYMQCLTKEHLRSIGFTYITPFYLNLLHMYHSTTPLTSISLLVGPNPKIKFDHRWQAYLTRLFNDYCNTLQEIHIDSIDLTTYSNYLLACFQSCPHLTLLDLRFPSLLGANLAILTYSGFSNNILKCSTYTVINNL